MLWELHLTGLDLKVISKSFFAQYRWNTEIISLKQIILYIMWIEHVHMSENSFQQKYFSKLSLLLMYLVF